MKSGKNLGIAYSVKKKAKGGRVHKGPGGREATEDTHGPTGPTNYRNRNKSSDMDHGQRRGPEGYGKYQEQAQNQKGVHTPVSGVTGFPGGKGRSEAGKMATETYAGKPHRELRDHGKDLHKKKLKEMQDMPKPNLPMAHGGSVDEGPSQKANQKGVNKILPTHDRKHNEVKHGVSEGGHRARTANKYGDDMKSSRELAMRDSKNLHRESLEELKSMPAPKLKGLAEGGEISDIDGGSEESMDHDSSMADAIMARRDRLHEEIDSGAHDLDSAVRMAEGGEVDIDENAEEQPNELYDLNEDAALKENYDSDMDDVSQPEDSNEDGHMIDEDDHDMVDKIRSGMKKRQR